ncbi:MAG: hypothetical protein ACKOPG_12210 [Novosphingobium sp.]
MEHEPAKFDWIGWLSSIPGIPAGWGDAPAESASAPVATIPIPPKAAARTADILPEPLAA